MGIPFINTYTMTIVDGVYTRFNVEKVFPHGNPLYLHLCDKDCWRRLLGSKLQRYFPMGIPFKHTSPIGAPFIYTIPIVAAFILNTIVTDYDNYATTGYGGTEMPRSLMWELNFPLISLSSPFQHNSGQCSFQSRLRECVGADLELNCPHMTFYLALKGLMQL